MCRLWRRPKAAAHSECWAHKQNHFAHSEGDRKLISALSLTHLYSFKILHIVSWCRKYPQPLQHFCAWRSWPSSLADTCEADMFKFFVWLSVLCVGSAAVVVCSYRKRVPLCARDWSRSKVKNFNMQDQSIVWKGCCLATNEICQGIRWQFLAWHYSIGCT